jgi:hypothetical protein
MQSIQMTLDLPNPVRISPKVRTAMDHLALNTNVNSRGAVFTRREVVDFILDLVGYTKDRPLHENDFWNRRLAVAISCSRSSSGC